jgi:hypothetical protein
MVDFLSDVIQSKRALSLLRHSLSIQTRSLAEPRGTVRISVSGKFGRVSDPGFEPRTFGDEVKYTLPGRSGKRISNDLLTFFEGFNMAHAGFDYVISNPGTSECE